MTGRSAVFKILLIFLLVLSSIPIGTGEANTETGPHAEFTVSPKNSSIQLSASGSAEGELDLKVAPQTNRLPADVIFVHETSKWMAKQKDEQVGKAVRAKAALTEGINYFEKNAKTGDAIHFVPFDTNVSNKTYNGVQIQPVTGIDNIRPIARIIDRPEVNTGDNHYGPALDKAMELLNNDSNRNKIIFFITDGNSKGADNREALEDRIGQLKQLNTVVHTIALNNSSKSSQHYQTLKAFSEATKGSIIEASETDMKSYFSRKVGHINNSYPLNGNITIDLSQVKDKDGKDVSEFIQFKNYSSNSRSIPVSIADTDGKFEEGVPLIFKKEGTYVLNHIKLSLNGKDFKGKATFVVKKGEASKIGVDLSVSPSSEEYIMPETGSAVGQLDIALTPYGEVTTNKRETLDVVFLLDTSMRPSSGLVNAKTALGNTINIIKENPQFDDDRFAFVPFAQKVNKGYSNPLTARADLQMLQSNIQNVPEENAPADYTSALQEANNKLNGSANEKHIILLTDGNSTPDSVNKKVKVRKNNDDHEDWANVTFNSSSNVITDDAEGGYKEFEFQGKWYSLESSSHELIKKVINQS
ncbi:MAG TPA: VWA domain-containing protein, partial [Pseudobacillus sp.]